LRIASERSGFPVWRHWEVCWTKTQGSPKFVNELCQVGRDDTGEYDPVEGAGAADAGDAGGELMNCQAGEDNWHQSKIRRHTHETYYRRFPTCGPYSFVLHMSRFVALTHTLTPTGGTPPPPSKL